MKKRQSFTKEFKLEAVRLLERGNKPAAEIARELGIARNKLYKWQEQLTARGRDDAFPGHGRRAGSEAEVARLRREVARLQEENAILKKAAQYFARASS
jgi:transposase